jgi:predicted secreted hydrolase
VRRPAPRARLSALVIGLLGARLGAAAAPADSPSPPVPQDFAAVVPGYAFEFPRDFGSHPQFRIEWWYVTGWLETPTHESLGFQITFFRNRPAAQDDNPSRFAPRQLLIAHCAISDPAHSGLWHDQRVRRAGLGLAEATPSDTRVWIDDWLLERRDDRYLAHIRARDFSLELTLAPTQPPLLNGDHGFSQKAPAARSASYYYSQPHLHVTGNIARADRRSAVSGEAWLDHEWSSEYLDPAAVGWDWIGLNLDDGGAIMAFRLRDRQGRAYWSGGTVREAGGQVRSLGTSDIEFTPLRRWRSPRSAVDYPVSFTVRVGERRFELAPLLDDQENDARLSSGAIYWEGAVSAVQSQRTIGRGYLELTGYDQPLSLGR